MTSDTEANAHGVGQGSDMPGSDPAPSATVSGAGTTDQAVETIESASESGPAKPAGASVAESTEPADAGAARVRVPTWVWLVLGGLAAALVAVTLALFVEARDTSENAKAAAASASQLLDDLVADVQTTNKELKDFNEQFASASASAQAKASEAKGKKSQRSSSSEPSP